MSTNVQDGTESILKLAADYVAVTQPVIDSYKRRDAEFAKQAASAASILAHRGIIAQRDVDTLVEKIAAEPVRVFQLIAKLAKLVEPEEMGKTSSESGAPQKIDGFTALVLYDDPTMTKVRTPAVLD